MKDKISSDDILKLIWKSNIGNVFGLVHILQFVYGDDVYKQIEEFINKANPEDRENLFKKVKKETKEVK